jgi:hypothetical protein
LGTRKLIKKKNGTGREEKYCLLRNNHMPETGLIFLYVVCSHIKAVRAI